MIRDGVTATEPDSEAEGRVSFNEAQRRQEVGRAAGAKREKPSVQTMCTEPIVK